MNLIAKMIKMMNEQKQKGKRHINTYFEPFCRVLGVNSKRHKEDESAE